MKHKSARLPKILQWIFLLTEVLAIVAALLFIFGSSFALSVSKDAKINDWPLSFGEIGLVLAKDLPLNANGGVQIEDLRASLRTNDPVLAKAFLKELQPSMISFTLILVTLFVTVCEFFRRFFKNVSHGKIFEESNITNLHKIGAVMIIFTLTFGVFQGVAQSSSAKFIEQNVEMESILVSDRQPGSPIGNIGLNLEIGESRVLIDFGGILSGLIIIALGEVFRQGLRLKEENELTI